MSPYYGEPKAGFGSAGSASSSADTLAASAAPIRGKIARACRSLALTEARAHAAGQLLGRARSADVVDAAVVQVAAGLGADVVTGDRGDISRLIEAAGASCRVIDV